MLVRAESPLRSIDELISRSQVAAGSFTLGNEGPRTFSGMLARLFNARTGAGANLVPYASVGVGTQDLMGGHVDAMVADLASTAALARQGRLRVLATTAASRVAGWESVPVLVVDAGMSPDALGAFLCAETSRWTAITREIGVLPE